MSRDEVAGVLGTDLMLKDHIHGADFQINKRGDIDISSDEMNLAQAILHRLRTVKGELSELGHPEYGSTIFDFVGLPNNLVTRERLRLAIRDAIRQERRVKETRSVTVKPSLQSITALPIGERAPNEISVSLATTNLSEGEIEEEPEAGPPAKSGAQPLRVSTDLLNSVDVDFVIVPVGSNRPVQISFPFNLEVT